MTPRQRLIEELYQKFWREEITLRQALLTMSQKTEEALRVKEILYRDDYEKKYKPSCWGCCGEEEVTGHDQAVSAQQQKAIEWRGEE